MIFAACAKSAFGLGRIAVEILLRRLGVDAGQAAVDLERALRVDRADHRDQPADDVRLVVGRVERERAVRTRSPRPRAGACAGSPSRGRAASRSSRRSARCARRRSSRAKQRTESQAIHECYAARSSTLRGPPRAAQSFGVGLARPADPGRVYRSGLDERRTRADRPHRDPDDRRPLRRAVPAGRRAEGRRRRSPTATPSTAAATARSPTSSSTPAGPPCPTTSAATASRPACAATSIGSTPTSTTSPRCRPPRAALAPDDAPLVLLGHSHGSLITLRALCDEHPPRRSRRAIVSSPYLGLRLAVPGYKKLLARVASRVAPKLAQPNALRVEDLTSDKEKQAGAARRQAVLRHRDRALVHRVVARRRTTSRRTPRGSRSRRRGWSAAPIRSPTRSRSARRGRPGAGCDLPRPRRAQARGVQRDLARSGVRRGPPRPRKRLIRRRFARANRAARSRLARSDATSILEAIRSRGEWVGGVP